MVTVVTSASGMFRTDRKPTEELKTAEVEEVFVETSMLVEEFEKGDVVR